MTRMSAARGEDAYGTPETVAGAPPHTIRRVELLAVDPRQYPSIHYKRAFVLLYFHGA